MRDKEEKIGKALVVMYGLYDKEPKPDVLAVFVNMLIEFEIDAIKAAINKIVRESKFIPKPADLIEILNPKPSEDSLKVYAANESDRVVESIRRHNSDCLEGDEITCYLMNTRWRLSREQDYMLEKDIPWFKKEFVEMYLNCYANPQMMEFAKAGKSLTNGEDVKSLGASDVRGLAEGLSKQLTQGARI